MVHAFEYACAHPFLLFLPALVFFLLPVFPAIAREREKARKEREREARRKAAEEKKREAEQKESTEDAAPKRGPGRPRKYPAPDPNAPKRPRGRPRKNSTPEQPAQRPEIISNPVPGDLEPPITPEEFINRIG